MTPFDYVLVWVIIIFGVRILWESELQLEARRKAYREGTHDYYGNPIKEQRDELEL